MKFTVKIYEHHRKRNVMNELRELVLFNLTTKIGYWDIVNERENSVNLDKVVDVVFDTISDYMKGGE